MKKVIIIGDSTAMPREGVSYEDTWIYMLKKSDSGIDFIDRSARGSTTDRLAYEGGGGVDLLETYIPDAAIITLGITDCAPRLFRKTGLEYRLINRFLPASLRDKYINYVKNKRGRNPLYTEVSPEKYRKNLENFLDRAAALTCRVIIIKIMEANSALKLKSPRASENIKLYNSIIDKIAAEKEGVSVIAPLSSVDMDSISTDETHPNTHGHNAVFKEVTRALNSTGICINNLKPDHPAFSEELQ